MDAIRGAIENTVSISLFNRCILVLSPLLSGTYPDCRPSLPPPGDAL